MARGSAIFDGTELNNEASRRYLLASAPDFGSQAVADQLLTGQYRLEEYDQVAQAMNLTRTVSLPLRLAAASQDILVTTQQTLTASLAGASRFAPKTFTWTPVGSSHVSTFRVYGGSWAPRYDREAEQHGILFGDLTLICDWPVRGAAQNLGSSGSPLVTNAASPAAVTLSPSPVGDVPGDVTLYVKNRHATLPIRSLMAAGISQNTTWVANVGQATWTLDSGSRASQSYGQYTGYSPPAVNTVYGIAHFTAPTLPSDRRIRVYLRGGHALNAGDAILFRIRVVSGQTEIIGPWRAFPQEYTAANVPPALADMGSYTFPVGSVGSLGAQSTNVYIETMNLVGTPSVEFFEALFMPDDSTLVIETSDTTKTIAAAAATVQIESHQAYASTGDPAGGAEIGANIRTLGGKYYVYTSQGYMGSLDTTLPYLPENVDVYATFTPRYIGLA